MIIAAKVVVARKRHLCAGVLHDRLTHAMHPYPSEPYVRLYGAAHRGDQPYALALCLDCADLAHYEPKVRAAVESYRRSIIVEPAP